MSTPLPTTTLADYDPDCYNLFTAIQLQTVFLRNPIIPVPAPVPAPTLLSPCMTAVLASTNNFSSSYFGSLAFLDFQSKFDLTSRIPFLSYPHYLAVLREEKGEETRIDVTLELNDTLQLGMKRTATELTGFS